MLRLTRVHANFAEYVPLCLILMALAELQDKTVWTIHLIGMLLMAGRVVHAFGVSRQPELTNLRVVGMVLTFAALVTGAFANLGLGSLVGTMLR